MALQTPYTNEQMLRLLSLAHRSSRKNLLKNWYFPRPANRRGKTEYDTNSAIIATVDWLRARSSKVTVKDDCVNIVPHATGSDYLARVFSSSFFNKTVKAGVPFTISLLAHMKSSTFSSQKVMFRICSSSGSSVSSSNGPTAVYITETNAPQLFTATFTLAEDVGSPWVEILFNEKEKTCDLDLYAWKMEPGTEQSLAYQDATGAWHLTEEPTEEEQRLWGLLPRLSNPNLLDNAYFADPINQRGQTEYTSTSGTTVYYIDRWRHRNASHKITLESDGVRITNNSRSYALYTEQYLEVPTLAQDTCLSVLVTEVTGTAYIQAAYDDGTFGAPGGALAVGLKTNVHSEGKRVQRILMQLNVGASIKLKAVKLEYGSEQTLAYQDDEGNWQLIDPPPNKQQELAKCQRYFVNFGSENYIGVSGMSWSTSANSAFVTIPIPVPMRALPTLTSYNVFLASANGTKFTVNSLAVLDMSPVAVRVRVTRDAAFAEGDQIACMLSNVALSAEL